MSQLD
ncbi:hypothetical protein D043_4079A, partial [Vibrio parahaemolyticus EKP-021]